MSAIEATREQQLAFNEAMVQQAGGLLAPLNGAEWYVTVSSGHVSQFCKAALSGCNNLNRKNKPRMCGCWMVGGQLGCGGRVARLPPFGREGTEFFHQAFQNQMELEIALHIHELEPLWLGR